MNTVPGVSRPVSQIESGKVLSEAWQLVYGFKWPVFLLTLLIQPAIFILIFLVQFLLLIITRSALLVMPVIFLALLYTIWFIACIAIMLGIRRAIGLPINVRPVADQCMARYAKLTALFLIYLAGVIVYTGIRYILPDNLFGLIVHLTMLAVLLYCVIPLYLFAMPLIVIRDCSIEYAIKSSYQKMNLYWKILLLIYVIMTIINVIAMIPFGIGLIWTAPMSYAAMGILFRDIYGLQKAGTPHPVDQPPMKERNAAQAAPDFEPGEVLPPEEENPPGQNPA